MAKHAPPEPEPPMSSLRRILWIAGPIVAVLALGFIFFWPSIQFQMRIGELHSADATVQAAARDALASSDRSDTNDRLYEALTDPDLSYGVRAQIGKVLIRRQRLLLVEKAVREEGLVERIAALGTLHDHVRGDRIWFDRDYASRPQFRVAETLLGWLGRDGDLSRAKALRIVADIQLAEALPGVRALLRGSDEGGRGAAARSVLFGAVSAAIALKDCASLERIAEIAVEDPEDRVRFQLVQALYRAARAGSAPCEGEFPAERVKEVLFAGAEGPPITRQTALALLAQEPAWAAEIEPRLLEILDGPDDFPVRREALSALAAAPGDTFARRLPRYFHDADPYVRSQAAIAARVYARRPDAIVRFESAWIGVVRDERENVNVYDTALSALRDSAGRWLGAPAALLTTDEARAKLPQFRRDLFEKGEAHGMDRATSAEAWWRWWAGKLGLGPGEIDAAASVRAAFWRAARAGDVGGARAALEGASRKDEGLWTYEWGWLLAH